MISPARVEDDERPRLFFALPLPAPDAEALAGWAAEVLAGGSGVRLLAAAQLHVTLVFLGATPAAELPELRAVLAAAAGEAERPVLTPRRYRETRRVGMVVFDDAGGRAAALQRRLAGLLEAAGRYMPERRAWAPHATVVRFCLPPGCTPEAPALAAVSPSEAALYHSVLRPGGAQYRIVDAAPLGG